MASPTNARLPGSGIVCPTFPEKVPEMEEWKLPKELRWSETAGLTSANERDIPRERPKSMAGMTAEVKLTLSGGCPTLKTNDGPLRAPKTESENEPDR